MNGARLSRAMSRPLAAPTSTPIATEITTITHTDGYMIASVRGMFRPRKRLPATAPVRPTVDPTDRSIPPLRITISIPRATMALKATCLVIVMRLPAVRKLSLSRAKIRMMMISAMKARPSTSTVLSEKVLVRLPVGVGPAGAGEVVVVVLTGELRSGGRPRAGVGGDRSRARRRRP